eukprot:scaffold118294_cov25-Prasinocladus_malaysianus.AAC.1
MSAKHQHGIGGARQTLVLSVVCTLRQHCYSLPLVCSLLSQVVMTHDCLKTELILSWLCKFQHPHRHAFAVQTNSCVTGIGIPY